VCIRLPATAVHDPDRKWITWLLKKANLHTEELAGRGLQSPIYADYFVAGFLVSELAGRFVGATTSTRK
jgi:hypothetical protein